MKKLLLILLVFFGISCEESNTKSNKPEQIKYVVELLNCDGTVLETLNASDVYYFSSGETKITLMNNQKIYYKGNLKSTKLFSKN